MKTLLLHVWPALAVASLLGLAFASIIGPGAGLPSARWDVRLGAILLLLAAILAVVLEVVPGRSGLWFEIGVLCACAYATGVAVGTVARMLLVRRLPKRGDVDAPDPVA